MSRVDTHIIVGTAGHVDHGKTLLTAALTGIDTDRLPEEKRRGLTIVPGFVALPLASGRRLGLIDVPGHERFIKNMLAGVAGIDMALLVIAADEGVMPQTREHLQILDLLGVHKGVCAITKSDLVDDEWLALQEEEIRALLASTHLAQIPLLPVSAKTGHNIDRLRALLDEAAAEVEPRPTAGRPRLPIDRLFHKAGFGAIATGTLWQGSIKSGDQLEFLPGLGLLRVRGLQVHGEEVTQAVAGQRVALNLAGPDLDALHTGCWLAYPGLLQSVHYLDLRLSLLAEAKPLGQRSRVRVHHGTTEVLGRVNLLDRETLAPGESCYAQLQLETALSPLRGDRLILRSYSPLMTIGGATVLDATPLRHRRFRAEVLADLALRETHDSDRIVLDTLKRASAPLSFAALAQAAQRAPEETTPAAEALLRESRLAALTVDGEQQLFLPELAAEWLAAASEQIASYQKRYPLRRGLGIAELKQRLFSAFHSKQLTALLAYWQQAGALKVAQSTVSLPDFAGEATGKDKAALERLLALYTAAGMQPPDWAAASKDFSPEQAAEYLLWLIEHGLLIKTGGLLFASSAFTAAEAALRTAFGSNEFTMAAARDILGSSRKFVQPLLEYLDDCRKTCRNGDLRQFLA